MKIHVSSQQCCLWLVVKKSKVGGKKMSLNINVNFKCSCQCEDRRTLSEHDCARVCISKSKSKWEKAGSRFIIVRENKHYAAWLCGRWSVYFIQETETLTQAYTQHRWLTDVQPPAEALHKEQHKNMEGNQVDDEDVSSPCRHLQYKTHRVAHFQILQYFASRYCISFHVKTHLHF